MHRVQIEQCIFEGLLSTMKRKTLILLCMIGFISCKEDSNQLPTRMAETNYDIEGKWIYKDNNLNTMYIYESGVRYTYYCVSSNCDSLYNTFEAGDSNAIPGTNPYTFEGDTLRVDLHFGNELVTELTFDCDGDKVYFETPGHHLYRLGSDCN